MLAAFVLKGMSAVAMPSNTILKVPVLVPGVLRRIKNWFLQTTTEPWWHPD